MIKHHRDALLRPDTRINAETHHQQAQVMGLSLLLGCLVFQCHLGRQRSWRSVCSMIMTKCEYERKKIIYFLSQFKFLNLIYKSRFRLIQINSRDCLFFSLSHPEHCVKIFNIRPFRYTGKAVLGEPLGYVLPLQEHFAGITSHLKLQMCDGTDPSPFI